MKITKNFISIIIVNWNGVETLDRCLKSLTKQTYKHLEIILVDNFSIDKSVNFVKNNFNNVKVIQNEKNYGFAKGNNIGIKHAKGDYILLINNDTWVEENFIQILFTKFRETDCDVISPCETEYTNSKYKNYKYTIDILGYPVLTTNKLFFLKGSCLLFKKSLYLQTLGFDEDFFMYYEELDWCWRLHLLQKRIYQDDDIFLYHLGSGMNKHKDLYLNSLWRNQNTLQMLIKNYSGISLIFVLPIYFVSNFLEILCLVLFLKTRLARTYIEGWYFNLKLLNKIIKKRKWIQTHRRVSDWQLLHFMYLGSGKLAHLFANRKYEQL